MAEEVEVGDDGGEFGDDFSTETQSQPEGYMLNGYADDSAQARGFHEMAGKYGGIDNLNKILEWYGNFSGQYHSDQELQKYINAGLDGSYKQQRAQQQQPQQPQQQQPQVNEKLKWLAYGKDPSVLAGYHLSMQNGGRLPDDYQGPDVAGKLQEIQSFWDNHWIDPEAGTLALLESQKIQDRIAEIAGRVVDPVRQVQKQQSDEALVAKYSPYLDKLDPDIGQMFKERVFGVGERAAQVAIAVSNIINSRTQQQQPPGQQKPKQQPGQQKQPEEEPVDKGQGEKNRHVRMKTEGEKRDQQKRANASNAGRIFARAKLQAMKGND